MTDSYRPHLRTQADLEAAWRHLIQPLGFHRRSLWLMMIDHGRPIPALTEITDLPDSPGEEDTRGLGELLGHLPPQGDESRWALLVSRPGSHGLDDSDRRWAAALYETMRTNQIPHDVVHVATDADILPVPLDDVTGYLHAS
jgi:hypothetical protein